MSIKSEQSDTSLIVLTPVSSGDSRYEGFLEYWEASLRRVMPNVTSIVHRYDPLKEKPFDVPGLRGDLAKMERTQPYRNLLTTDVDTLFVAPFTYRPSSPDILLAMPVKWLLSDTDETREPDEWGARMIQRIHERVGLGDAEPFTLQTWVIWSSGDLMPLFEKYKQPVIDALAEEPEGAHMPFTIPLLGVMWHVLRREGRAEVMPGNFLLHLPVYPIPRRLEMANKLWQRIVNANKSD